MLYTAYINLDKNVEMVEKPGLSGWAFTGQFTNTVVLITFVHDAVQRRVLGHDGRADLSECQEESKVDVPHGRPPDLLVLLALLTKQHRKEIAQLIWLWHSLHVWSYKLMRKKYILGSSLLKRSKWSAYLSTYRRRDPDGDRVRPRERLPHPPVPSHDNRDVEPEDEWQGHEWYASVKVHHDLLEFSAKY